METNSHKIIIKTLDNMPRMLFWGIDEFVIMFAPVFLGIVMGSVVVMVSGFFAKYFYSKQRNRFPRGYIRHVLYWSLPKDVFIKFGALKQVPPSHVREYTL